MRKDIKSFFFPSLLVIGTLLSSPQSYAQSEVSARKVCSILKDIPNENAATEVENFELDACFIIVQELLTKEDTQSIEGLSSIEDLRPGSLSISSSATSKLIKKIKNTKELFRKQRQNVSSKRFQRGCFNAEDQGTLLNALSDVFSNCALRRTNTPGSADAGRPAEFSFTRTLRSTTLANGTVVEPASTFDINAAFNGSQTFGTNAAASFRTEYQRNTAQGQEQANFSIGLGGIFDVTTGASLTDDLLFRLPDFDNEGSSFLGYQARNAFSSYRFAADLSYNRMGVFGSADSDACVADMTSPLCGRQNLETLRLTTTVVPYFDLLNGVLNNGPAKSSSDKNIPRLHWSVSPDFGLFFDDALNDDVVVASGDPVTGSVYGGRAGFSAAISPSVMKNRWRAEFSGHIIEAFERDAGRVTTFEKVSRQFDASLSFALRDNAYLEQTDTNFLIPAISITYTNGSDSLRGRSGRESVTVALSLFY